MVTISRIIISTLLYTSPFILWIWAEKHQKLLTDYNNIVGLMLLESVVAAIPTFVFSWLVFVPFEKFFISTESPKWAVNISIPILSGLVAFLLALPNLGSFMAIHLAVLGLFWGIVWRISDLDWLED